MNKGMEADLTTEEAEAEVTIVPGPDEFAGYFNIAAIVHTPEEVFIHLAQRDPSDPRSAMGVARLYTSPGHARRFVQALAMEAQAVRKRNC